MERRLAAILAADAVTFSAFVGRDEEQAIRKLKAHVAALEPMIGFHSGRIFKDTGDGFLVEFGSVVDAVSCADAMQKQMAERNADEPADERLDFRMGLHTGDIIVDGDDILGDGVNIASRLEAVAGAGGIAVSARVRDDVIGKLDIAFDDIGVRELKNIAQPVHVYAIGAKSAVQATHPVGLPEKPSLAVLPFTNMSPQAGDDYFADGVTEDIITALTYVPWIFVIARNSSFTYKGLSIDVRKVGLELGVRYVLEGSVRRSGDRLRVTGQLIDADTGNHIWAERYDGLVDDIFDLQDEISEAVVTAIAPEIKSAEIQRGVRKSPENLDAYDMYLRGQHALHLGRMDEADDWLAKSIDAAPTFAKAMALRAWLGTAVHLYGRIATQEKRQLGLTLAHEAIDLEPADPEVLAYAGYTIGFFEGDPERGLRFVEQATAQCPSFAFAWASGSLLCSFAGRSDLAIERAKISLRLSPRDPMAFRCHMSIALASIINGNHAQVLESAGKGMELNPRASVFYRYKTISLVELGRLEEAAKVRDQAMRLTPGFRTSEFIRGIAGVAGVSKTLWRKYEVSLLKAGFPE